MIGIFPAINSLTSYLQVSSDVVSRSAYLDIQIVMFYQPVNCPKSPLLPNWITKYVHLNCSPTDSTHILELAWALYNEHSRQCLRIYKAYVLKISFHLSCILMFSTALENEHPGQEQGLNASDITGIERIGHLLI